MFDQVLVPVDRSTATDCLLPHAAVIANAFASATTLLHVFEEKNDGGRVDPLDWYMHRGKAQAYLNAVKGRLKASCAEAEAVLLDGQPAERILAYANEYEPSLLVLSNAASGANESGCPGRVAYKVVSQIRRSVLLVRGNAASARGAESVYRRILVPLDGSKRAEIVLPAAIALAARSGATLVLAHAVSEPQLPFCAPDLAEATAEVARRNWDEGTAYLENIQKQIDLPTETRLAASCDVIAALHGLCESEKPDLVLMSAHGYSCCKQWAYGRVATSFLYGGSTSLLLVQDMPRYKIEESPAERAASEAGNQAALRHNTVPSGLFY